MGCRFAFQVHVIRFCSEWVATDKVAGNVHTYTINVCDRVYSNSEAREKVCPKSIKLTMEESIQAFYALALIIPAQFR